MLTEFENHRTNLMVVMAGYQKPMDDFMVRVLEVGAKMRSWC